MRLDFNVLWVDDQRDRIESTRETIEIDIRREGFRLQVIFATSVEEAKKYLSEEIYGDHIDLVLMDYDLGAGGRGDDGLVEVRRIFEYKDIIFYSSQAPDLPAMVAEKKIQGVFCSTRDTLHETVQGIFDVLMKKVLDIDHSRGIVMGASSDIDYLVNSCIKTSFDKNDDEGRTYTLKVVGKHIAEKEKSLNATFLELKGIKDVEDLYPHHGTYTSNDRLRLLKKILEKNGVHKETIPLIASYLKETISKRNDLAHLRVVVNGFSRKLYNRNGDELTSQEMKLLRNDLLDFQIAMESLHSKLHS